MECMEKLYEALGSGFFNQNLLTNLYNRRNDWNELSRYCTSQFGGLPRGEVFYLQDVLQIAYSHVEKINGYLQVEGSEEEEIRAYYDTNHNRSVISRAMGGIVANSKLLNELINGGNNWDNWLRVEIGISNPDMRYALKALIFKTKDTIGQEMSNIDTVAWRRILKRSLASFLISYEPANGENTAIFKQLKFSCFWSCINDEELEFLRALPIPEVDFQEVSLQDFRELIAPEELRVPGT